MNESQVIKSALKAMGKTQQDLAAAMNQSRETINKRLANNDIDEELVKATCSITGISFDVLINEINKYKKEELNAYEVSKENDALRKRVSDLTHELEKRDLKIESLSKEVEYLKILNGMK
jgi:transcriptional regulator with XRE-family HTH domain